MLQYRQVNRPREGFFPSRHQGWRGGGPGLRAGLHRRLCCEQGRRARRESRDGSVICVCFGGLVVIKMVAVTVVIMMVRMMILRKKSDTNKNVFFNEIDINDSDSNRNNIDDNISN